MTVEDVVVEHEGPLFGLAYRILGSVVEAEDAVQEAFLRYSQATEVEHPRSWLTTVVTRLCLDRLRSAQRRREDYVGPWLPEPLVVDAADPAGAVEMAESLSMAFLVVLEALSPEERVAFLLHDVFSLGFDEIAAMLGKSPAATRQLASRARRRITERPHRFEADPHARDTVADAFLVACAGGDMQTLLDLLAPDVVLTSDGGGVVAAARRPVVGADAVARFLTGLLRLGGAASRARRMLVNGTPGLVVDHPSGRTVMAVDVAGRRVVGIAMVRNPAKLTAVPHWGVGGVFTLGGWSQTSSRAGKATTHSDELQATGVHVDYFPYEFAKDTSHLDSR